MENLRTAVVLARAGSKRIPNKNLSVIGGLTLLQRTINAAAENSLEVIVSSDSEEILDLAFRYGAVIHRRSLENSKDESSSEDAAIEVISEFQDKFLNGEIILLPVTSPLRDAKVIKNFLLEWDMKYSGKKDQAISVHIDYSDLWVKEDESSKRIREILGKDFLSRRSQERRPLYIENSAIYISRVEKLLESKSFISKDVALIEIPRIAAFDINDQEDIWITNALLNALNS